MMRNNKTFDTELNHDLLVANIQQELAYDEREDYATWRARIKEKFRQLTGLVDIEKNACPLNLQIEWEEDKETYRLIRFTFESEVGETVPCYLCIPKTGKKKYPVAITMQGHSTGFHNSIGEPKFEQDEKYLADGRGAFALQAVENGYIALAIEQRGMGERQTHTANRHPMFACRYASLLALHIGRTILGERVWDVSKAIDALANFPECDTEKIFITGNSGGGTASYYAACYDERIKFSAPSCSFAPYKESILSIAHCLCNYIPSAYKYFEMQDLSCLIAPRPLVVIAGVQDEIFPIESVRRGFDTVQKVYNKVDAPDNCRLVETPKGHWWCVDIVWNAINETCKKLGWR